MGGIALEGVSKVFPGDVVAVDDVDLQIGDGEFMAVSYTHLTLPTILRV